jgi:peptide/nickel transport system permease protein
MNKYIRKRLLQIILVMLGVIIFVFILKTIAPGDPVDYILGDTATEAAKMAKRQELGLNDPILIQFFRYLLGILHGDLGTSYITKQPIFAEIMSKLPLSLFIALGAVIGGTLIGIPMGICSALHHNSFLDNLLIVTSMFFSSIPNFCLAFVLIIIFSVNLKLLPSFGVATPACFIMPLLTMILNAGARTANITRSSMLEVIRQDYIRTAKAKGLNQHEITYHHIIRNGMIPVLNFIGNQMAGQLGGAIIVETVFGVPGLGNYIANAITLKDYPAVQGGVVIMALTISLINLFVDIGFVIIDPRLKTRILGKGSAGKKKSCAA